MKLFRASKKAVKYSVENFHYSKFASPRCYDYPLAVYNEKNEFCGVICFGRGAHSSMGKPYKLNSGQYLELMRTALNGKQESTSKAISAAIKIIKKNCPTVQLLITFADKRQGHYGTIYQATNWIFTNDIQNVGKEYFYKNKWTSGNFGKNIDKNKLQKRDAGGRYKYLYPLTKEMKELCEKLKKPYPKRVKSIDSDATPYQEEEGGANPTLTHQ